MAVVNKGAGRMTHQGQHRLSRRKYQELVKFLKSVMTNEKAGLKVRYAAAARLDDIFKRHEEAESRITREQAKGATATASQGADSEAGDEPDGNELEAPEDAEDTASEVEKFLAGIRAQKQQERSETEGGDE